MTGGRDQGLWPGSWLRHQERPRWICGTNEYSLGILGNTWDGELKGKKVGFPACGMEFFQLGVKGKD